MVTVIFNPASGGGDSQARRQELDDLARATGVITQVLETTETEGAGPLARRALDAGAARVLVCGGDGSVTEAAGVLAGTMTALGVIPAGTGNLLALNLGLPTDPLEAMQCGIAGAPYPTDVGRANGAVFLPMVGMGADARMIRDADRELKKRLGPFAYFLPGWKHRGRTRASYTMTIDGRCFRRRAHTVLVANLGRVTGGVELVPGAAPRGRHAADSHLARARGVWGLAQVALTAILGNSQSRSLLEVHRGRQIRIETARPQPVQLDGNEAQPTAVLEIAVEPGALQLVRPALRRGEAPPAPPLPAALAAARVWAPIALGAAGLAGLAYMLWRKRPKG